MRAAVIVASLLISSVCAARKVGPVVIDTDMGLDDLVALSVALQSPDLDIKAVVAAEGVASAATSVELLERLLHRFNRNDIVIYQAAALKRPTPPPFRQRAVGAVRAALSETVARRRRPFSPEAFRHKAGRTVVLALAPLTNLGAALRARPTLKREIGRVIFEGQPDPKRSWNARFDRAALAAVKASGVTIEYVVKGPGGRKPARWRKAPLILQPTTIGAQVVERMLSAPGVRRHYASGLPLLTDELGPLYLVAPALFRRHRVAGHMLVQPRDARRTARRLVALLRTDRPRRRPKSRARRSPSRTTVQGSPNR